MKKHIRITAVWRNGGGSGNINVNASNKHLCLADSEVLQIPPLRQAANPCGQPCDTEQDLLNHHQNSSITQKNNLEHP